MPWISQSDLGELYRRIDKIESACGKFTNPPIPEQLSTIRYELCWAMIDLMGETVAEEHFGNSFYSEFTSAKVDHRLYRYSKLPDECKNGHKKSGGKK